jgi:hypothetical protein
MNMRKYILLIFVLFIQYSKSQSQVLSSIQTKSVKIKSIIKIDGYKNDWNNQFEAFNKSVGIHYTLANNSDKLYLIIKAETEQVINKIISQGVTFIVKNEKQNFSFSYPVYEKEKRPLFLSIKQRKILYKNNKNTQHDSLKNSFNSKLTENLLKIGITGISSIKDSLVTIYNQEGIRANGKFDNQVNYILELAIPLELLNIKEKFNYTIQLNGVPGKVEIISTSIGDRITYTRHGENWMVGKATPENYALAYPSSLSGTYTLAK